MESLHQSLLDYEDFDDQYVNLPNIAKALCVKSNVGTALRARFYDDLNNFVLDYSMLMNKTESPIEKQFLEVLFVVAPSHGLPICDDGIYKQKEDKMEYPSFVNPYGLFVFPQFELNLEKKYVVDFLLVTMERYEDSRTLRKLVIECDGHDFHEKTKEQAKKDKSRDRDLTANGFPVFRFTGSEIHNNALDCAEQVSGFLARRFFRG